MVSGGILQNFSFSKITHAFLEPFPCNVRVKLIWVLMLFLQKLVTTCIMHLQHMFGLISKILEHEKDKLLVVFFVFIPSHYEVRGPDRWGWVLWWFRPSFDSQILAISVVYQSVMIHNWYVSPNHFQIHLVGNCFYECVFNISYLII